MKNLVLSLSLVALLGAQSASGAFINKDTLVLTQATTGNLVASATEGVLADIPLEKLLATDYTTRGDTTSIPLNSIKFNEKYFLTTKSGLVLCKWDGTNVKSSKPLQSSCIFADNGRATTDPKYVGVWLDGYAMYDDITKSIKCPDIQSGDSGKVAQGPEWFSVRITKDAPITIFGTTSTQPAVYFLERAEPVTPSTYTPSTGDLVIAGAPAKKVKNPADVTIAAVGTH